MWSALRHDLVVVLDDEERVALGAQRLERRDQPLVVARVQADARLVQHVQDAGEVGAELRGQPDPLRLAAGQGLRRAVEREVVQPDPVEELQSLLDLGDDVLHDQPAARVGRKQAQLRRAGWEAFSRRSAGSDSGGPLRKWSFTARADPVQPLAAADGAGPARFGDILGGIDPELAQAGLRDPPRPSSGSSIQGKIRP